MRNSDDQPDQLNRYFSRGFFRYGFLISSFLLFLSCQNVRAQLTEIGFEAGLFNFTGDLSRDYNLKSQRPAFSVSFKSNISQSTSLRYGISGGMLSGNDQLSDDPFNQIRNESFEVYLLEAFAVLEFYFLDYKSKHALIHWTPYLSLGLGAFTILGEKAREKDFFPVQPAIPMGIGIKYQLSPKFDLGIEASARATFFDQIDGISGSDDSNKDYDYGNKYDFDSYYFIGLTLNYTFYFIPCPYGYD